MPHLYHSDPPPARTSPAAKVRAQVATPMTETIHAAGVALRNWRPLEQGRAAIDRWMRHVWIPNWFIEPTRIRWINPTEDDFEISVHPPTAGRASKSLDASKRASRADVTTIDVLCLAEKHYVSRQIRLPPIPLPSLDKAVALQIEQVTPFRQADVYSAFRIVGEMPTSGSIIVEIFVSPRRIVEGLRQRLAAAGLSVDTVIPASVGPASLDCNLLPCKRIARPVAPKLCAALAALLVGQALVAAYLPVHFARLATERLQQESQDALALAGSVSAKFEDALNENKIAEYLASQGRALPPFTPMLSRLTETLPDSAYLERLSYHPGQLRVIGYAKSTSVVVDELAKLGGVTYAAPATVAPNAERERFDLILKPALPAGH